MSGGATDASTDAGTVVDAGAAPDGGAGSSDGGPSAEADAGVVIQPTGTGWSRLADTKLSSVCPNGSDFFGFDFGWCSSVITAWSGGVADTKRNRLEIWGGGHNDYYGNELYALDLTQNRMLRLNDPTALAAPPECTGTLSDGKPNGRHTYGGLAYVTHRDQMTVLGGAISCRAGGISADAWLLDFAKLASTPNSADVWHRVTDNVADIGYGGIIGASDYDPVTRRVYSIDSHGDFLSFDPDVPKVSVLDSNGGGGYHFTAVVDPVNRLFVIIGGGLAGAYPLDGSTHPYTEWTSSLTGCDDLLNVVYPGLTYDTDEKQIVGWASGAKVFVLDPVAKRCTTRTFSGDAPGAPPDDGTNGRFRYFAAMKAFVLVNGADLDAYILKMK